MRYDSTVASDIRSRIVNGEYPDDNRACDLCSGAALASPSQPCEHRCKCGRFLKCEHGGTKLTARMWAALAVAAADSALWAIERGAADEAAVYAKDCVTACRRHQLAGGHPTDKVPDPFRGFRNSDIQE